MFRDGVWRRGAVAVALTLAVLLAGCAERAVTRPLPQAPVVPDKKKRMSIVRYGDLPGWRSDRHGEALAAFHGSCSRWRDMSPGRALADWPGVVGDMRKICLEAARISAKDHQGARLFFERNFVPFRVSKGKNPQAKVTGYFEPVLRGSTRPSSQYHFPLYRAPDDLVSADLSEFKDTLRGVKLYGRVDGKRFIPYFTRAEIDGGALNGRGLEIVWVDEPVDAFFLHVQGSGRVILEDGSALRVGFAAKNGHNYASIGRELIRRGELAKGKASMRGIKEWARRNPQRLRTIFAVNRSYIFFRPLKTPAHLGPPGAMQVPLTAGRSIAVDPAENPLGMPVYLSLDRGVPGGSLHRLVVAQDTGGVIKGPVRGDLFWGSGPQAGRQAGSMTGRGLWFALVPRLVAERLRPVS